VGQKVVGVDRNPAALANMVRIGGALAFGQQMSARSLSWRCFSHSNCLLGHGQLRHCGFAQAGVLKD
jgi:hypothetical protein